MAKRTAHLHIGLPHSGGERLDAALQEHADVLRERGVLVPSTSTDEMFRAAVELRREHKAWGLRRKDVEGVWAGICRRAHKGRGDVVVGHPLLAGATPAEIDLLVDRLAGFAIHVVVTVGVPDARLSAFPDDHDLVDVLRRWSAVVSSPSRVHVVACDVDAPADAWAAFGRVLGVDTTDLELPGAVAGEVDVHALRLIAEGTASLASADELAAIADEWAKVVADEGYDVHGDLAGLVAATRSATDGQPGELTVAALGDALSDTLAEVTRLRARTVELERDNARLVKKRRKLKDRLAELG
jgi:hypothetical protein